MVALSNHLLTTLKSNEALITKETGGRGLLVRSRSLGLEALCWAGLHPYPVYETAPTLDDLVAYGRYKIALAFTFLFHVFILPFA